MVYKKCRTTPLAPWDEEQRRAAFGLKESSGPCAAVCVAGKRAEETEGGAARRQELSRRTRKKAQTEWIGSNDRF